MNFSREELCKFLKEDDNTLGAWRNLADSNASCVYKPHMTYNEPQYL